ncbi:hypothetical protein PIB30_000598 [Stylosanthes scabra]|uniref:Uncharacterized protein n=1 Tax=Stylosanthes scabra TaxID=79078 RepID=A0ABU6X2P5_9FABA|nr:hypothetical protein [Stylosanthes scabra]
MDYHTFRDGNLARPVPTCPALNGVGIWGDRVGIGRDLDGWTAWPLQNKISIHRSFGLVSRLFGSASVTQAGSESARSRVK